MFGVSKNTVLMGKSEHHLAPLPYLVTWDCLQLQLHMGSS